MNELPATALDALARVAETGSFTAAAASLGVSTSAISQAVRALESRVGVPLVVRTTRSARLTDAGSRLAARAGAALREAREALDEASRTPATVGGTLRLNLPHLAVQMVARPLLRALRAAHPALTVEMIVEDRNVDIVREGYDAGIRLVEAVEKDMVVARVAPPFRFVVVGAPAYLAARGAPKHPRDLTQHACVNFRSMTTGRIYRWELDAGRSEQRVSVTGSLVTNDLRLAIDAAIDGAGLAYAAEPMVADALRDGALRVVLPRWSAAVPGLFLYLPNAARRDVRMRALLACAKSLAQPPTAAPRRR